MISDINEVIKSDDVKFYMIVVKDYVENNADFSPYEVNHEIQYHFRHIADCMYVGSYKILDYIIERLVHLGMTEDKIYEEIITFATINKKNASKVFFRYFIKVPNIILEEDMSVKQWFRELEILFYYGTNERTKFFSYLQTREHCYYVREYLDEYNDN